ncbi:MAG TPA: hypothetical protein VI564_03820 [Candidatus Nanoarchaeia archaeon]|nr:hypothetical protein [Candidatus Nanoarchaeia archaeon]
MKSGLDKKNAQSSLEFIVLASFLFLVVVLFLALMSTSLSDSNDLQKEQSAIELSDLIMGEITTARSVNDGYSRTFEIPKSINGINYTVKIIDSRELVVNFLDYEYVRFMPSNFSGNISRGQNRISKTSGIVYIQNLSLMD